MSRPVTAQERHLAHALAEAPGAPDDFPFEELDATTQRMVRARLAEINGLPNPEIGEDMAIEEARAAGGVLVRLSDTCWVRQGHDETSPHFTGVTIQALLDDGAVRPLRYGGEGLDTITHVALIYAHDRVKELPPAKSRFPKIGAPIG